MKKRFRSVYALLFALTIGFSLSSVQAADENTQPASKEAASQKVASSEAQPAAEKGPKQVAFEKIFGEWKELLIQLQKFREEYPTASSERRKEIVPQYEALIQKGVEMEPRLSASAEEAYAENPGADKDLEQFLLASCLGNIKMDNYEDAYRLAQLLKSSGVKYEKLNAWAGVAGFCIGELDEAQKNLSESVRAGKDIRTQKESLDAIVDQFLMSPGKFKRKWDDEQKVRQAEAKADDLPRVLLKTDEGDMVIELFENEAPNSTANFISLVESGFYDGLGFHRVLEGFMAQGGCPRGDGMGDPGYSIPCEVDRPGARNHFRGSLSMAHAGKDTGGSQFFITFIPTTFLDGRHTVFGRIIDGMDILAKIRRRDPSDRKATMGAPTHIIEARVLRKRDHEYKPVKIGDEKVGEKKEK